MGHTSVVYLLCKSHEMSPKLHGFIDDTPGLPLRMRTTRRRCSAKYLFRSSNSAGWQVINFHRRLLGNFYHFWYFDPLWLDEEKLRETGEGPFHGKGLLVSREKK